MKYIMGQLIPVAGSGHITQSKISQQNPLSYTPPRHPLAFHGIVPSPNMTPNVSLGHFPCLRNQQAHATMLSAARKLQHQTTQKLSMQFNTSSGTSLSPNDATLSISTDGLPLNTPVMSHINNALSCLWNTPKSQPTQIAAVNKIIFNPESHGRLIIIDCMGGRVTFFV